MLKLAEYRQQLINDIESDSLTYSEYPEKDFYSF